MSVKSGPLYCSCAVSPILASQIIPFMAKVIVWRFCQIKCGGVRCAIPHTSDAAKPHAALTTIHARQLFNAVRRMPSPKRKLY